jgi:hypothetical protein
MLAAVAAVVAPLMASAAVLSYYVDVGVSYAYGTTISPGGHVAFRFIALDDIRIRSFAISATASGTDAAEAMDDIADVTFGFTSSPSNKFTTIGSSGNVAFGGGFLLPSDSASPSDSFFDVCKNCVFFIHFEDGITNDVGLALSFATAPIPLPAAGMLLAPVLVAGGIAAARRRKAKASEV